MKYFMLIFFAVGASILTFAQEKSDETTSNLLVVRGTNLRGNEPFYFASEGETIKEITLTGFEKIDTRRVISIKVLSTAESADRYGERGRYGAVIVNMKGNSFSENYPGKKQLDK